jgi:hypothetical protein
MRIAAVLAIVSLALPACARSGGPVVAPTSPAPVTTVATEVDVPRVRAAVEATRAKRTATFVMRSRTVMGSEWMEARREGSYDLARGRSSVVQTFAAFPPAALAELTGGKVPASGLESHALVTENGGYLQMRGWPAPANTKWLHFDTGEVPRLTQGAIDVEAAIVPGAVTILAQAERSARDGTGGALAYVVVPASAAFLSFPTVAKGLVDEGVDPEKITGEIEVEVGIRDGLVTGVFFDALPAFRQAYAQLGQSELGDLIAEQTVTVDVRGHGRPVTIPLPPAKDVMTDAEFRSYSRQ